MDGDKLRRERDRRALSMRELADLAGVSWVTVWRIENGRRVQPHPSTLRKLAAALAVEPAELMKSDT